LPGNAQKQLTPSEALFGTVGGEGTISVGYAGRLLIDDIPLEILLERIKISRPAGGQPKPEHESFYFAPGSAGPVILGRKFYYHQQDYQRTLDVYERDRRMPVISIQAVPAQQNLRGSLRFLCLTEAELAALVYSLVLEEGLAHKLGYGKPLGLGSLQVTINQLALDAGPDGQRQRFLSYDMPDTEDWTARVAALRDAARETWRNRQGGGAASYAAFTAIARWPQDQDFVYPDFGFFRKERNQPSKTTLWQYQERRQYHPGDTAPAHVAPTLDESRVRPAADEPVERVGMFSYADDLGYFILDEADNMRCQCRSRDRKLMRRLSDMLSADEAPRVAFRRELQRGPGNQDQPVATELRLLKGDD
jgi:hypothetical protein